jgi:hypothetical protein
MAALLFVGLCAGLLAIVGCSENVQPGTSRESVCSAVTDDAFSWWLAVLWPVVAYAASWLIPTLRRYAASVGFVVGVLAVGFWATLLVIVAN